MLGGLSVLPGAGVALGDGLHRVVTHFVFECRWSGSFASPQPAGDLADLERGFQTLNGFVPSAMKSARPSGRCALTYSGIQMSVHRDLISVTPALIQLRDVETGALAWGERRLVREAAAPKRAALRLVGGKRPRGRR
jgi:hypothetical protein